MPRELILSVGLNKTGTQSLQKTCMANMTNLRKAGVTFPTYAMPGLQGTGNHNVMLVGAFGSLPLSRQHLQQQIRAQIAATLERAEGRVLLVAVRVSEFDIATLHAMRAWFEERGWPPRVVCGIRHLDTWLHSVAAQRVVGQRHMTLHGAMDEFLAQGLVKSRLENLRAVFPAAEFYSHEQAIEQAGGPVEAFLDRIGVDRSAVRIERANEGASDIAVRALSAFNEKFRSRPHDAEKIAGFLRNLPGRKFALSPEDVPQSTLQLVAAENEWLGATFGPAYQGGPLDLLSPAQCPASVAAAIRRHTRQRPDVMEWLAHRLPDLATS
jgi:hypothetical protein